MESICDVDPHEDTYRVLYLDHDPMRSALYTVDRDIEPMLVSACQHLSNAWHSVGADYVLVDWCSPARHPEPTPPGETPWLRAARLHQRIFNQRKGMHPCSQWAASLGGNYAWLWENAMELTALWRTIKGAPHALTPMVYTLEVMPPVLLTTSQDRSEPPVTAQPEYHVHTPDGLCVEAVDSWRRYYVKRRQGVLRWSTRPVPDWLERRDNRYELK